MSLINITNLTFSYEGSYDNIFENVSFKIDTDWRLGFIGRNGRGKTTFLKLLMGQYEYSGNISSNIYFDYFPNNIIDKTKNTIDILESIDDDFQIWKILQELSYLDVNEDTLYRAFNSLSHGEQTKILLASLFTKDNNFLLIDEPTNHLDEKSRKLVSDYLNSKHGFILISHDRTFLDNSIDHVISINKTNIEVQKGNFSSWFENKNLQDNFEIAENKKLKKDIKRLNASAKRSSQWSDKIEKSKSGEFDKGFIGHKAAKMMKRSKSIEARKNKSIEEKSGLLKNIEAKDSPSIHPIKYHNDNILYFENVSVYYDEKIVCKNISFDVCRDDRIAIDGANGSGKSSILKLILGENIKYSGNIHIGSNLKISYVSQDTSFLKGDLKYFARDNAIDETLFKSILRHLDFERIQFEKDISFFSEGQKKKVLIAYSLCQEAHLYIWDEPLNFIDIISRMQIEDLLLEYKPTILFVEHDSIFRQKILNKVLSI